LPSETRLFLKRFTLLVGVSTLLKLKLFVNPGIIIILQFKLTIKRWVLRRRRVFIVAQVSVDTFHRS
jgi:hypothetical protein